MAPSAGVVRELDEKSVEHIVKFVASVRSGKLKGSYSVAMATVDLLEQVINDAQNTIAPTLLHVVKEAGRRVCRALPPQPALAAANMVRRVLRAVRDEQRAQHDQGGEGEGSSLQRLVLATPSRRATLGAAADLREPIRDHIAELRAELEGSGAAVVGAASAQLRGGDTLLLYGAAALPARVLRAAAATAHAPRVLLAEGPDARESASLAVSLGTAGVRVTLVSGAAAAGLMPRVNKVLVGARAVLAGGAALGEAGLLAVTTAAKYYNVPVLVAAPLYKLSPLQAGEPRRAAAPAPPHHALPCQSSESAQAHVFAPQYDVIPPDHITLFITNLGGSSPSYMYRLLAELYDPDDYEI